MYFKTDFPLAAAVAQRYKHYVFNFHQITDVSQRRIQDGKMQLVMVWLRSSGETIRYTFREMENDNFLDGKIFPNSQTRQLFNLD